MTTQEVIPQLGSNPFITYNIPLDVSRLLNPSFPEVGNYFTIKVKCKFIEQDTTEINIIQKDPYTVHKLITFDLKTEQSSRNHDPIFLDLFQQYIKNAYNKTEDSSIQLELIGSPLSSIFTLLMYIFDIHYMSIKPQNNLTFNYKEKVILPEFSILIRLMESLSVLSQLSYSTDIIKEYKFKQIIQPILEYYKRTKTIQSQRITDLLYLYPTFKEYFFKQYIYQYTHHVIQATDALLA